MAGNSDGISLATTKRLPDAGWNIVGISRSQSPITSTDYRHRVEDVSDGGPKLLDELLSEINDAVGGTITVRLPDNGWKLDWKELGG
jgi:NAD(P)-dependent dehydrogenase (short-subunit alcohol dehydrogenase family)